MVVVVGYQSAIDNLTPGVLTENNGVWTGSQVPAHDVVIGAAGFTLAGVTPSSTSGVPLISQGASSNPTFGTAVVAGGGTGLTSATAYAVLCGGTSSTGAFQSIASVGTAGQILTSNGAGALPSFQAISASGAITTITGNSGGAQSPLSGNFNILGTGSITIAGTTNTETIQLTGLTNHNVLVGAGTATITTVAPNSTSGIPLVSNGSAADPSFNTALVVGGGTGITTATSYAPICGGTTPTGAFQVASTGQSTNGAVLTSNGTSALPSFQTIASVGAITTITGNSGGAQSPNAGNFNILGTGSITTAGTTNTETIQLTGLTNHAVLVGAGTSTITNVGPTATAGQVLQSAGSSADPSFSTATYPSTTTVSQLLYSSSTNTIAGLATANTAFLKTNGSGVPAWNTNGLPINKVVVQTFTSSGTYTPTSGMVYCTLEVVGGGGGGGCANTTASTELAAGAGGGGGGYSRKTVSAATIGASQTVTIGAAGAGSTSASTNGGTGGTTSVGAILNATGGTGGNYGQAFPFSQAIGGTGGSGSGGDINFEGNNGGSSVYGEPVTNSYICVSGCGGSSYFGGAGQSTVPNSAGFSAPANSGGGGSGGSNKSSQGAIENGGNGASGIVVITEFLSI